MERFSGANQPVYDPNRLLNALWALFNIRNDAALCRLLEVSASVISKVRHGRLPLGAALLIRIHEVTHISIRELRDLMGDRRRKYRASDTYGRFCPDC